MFHNLKNLPSRQIHLLKGMKRENALKISLICLKCWTDGSAVPVGLRGRTSDAEEVQKMPTPFNLQPWNASWLPPSNSMTQRPEFRGSWWSTRHGCADGDCLQTQRLLLLPRALLPHWLLILCPNTRGRREIQGPHGLDFPQVSHSKKKTPCKQSGQKELSCKSCGWGLWGRCQPTHLPQQCHTSGDPSRHLRNIIPRGFSSIETPPLFLTTSSLVIIKISQPSPKVTSCRLKPELPKNLPNTTILRCKAPIAWKCADFTKKLYKRQQDWPAGQSVQLPARLPASPRVGTPSSLIQKLKISYEKASKGWGFCFLQLSVENKCCTGVRACVRKAGTALLHATRMASQNQKNLRKIVFWKTDATANSTGGRGRDIPA